MRDALGCLFYVNFLSTKTMKQLKDFTVIQHNCYGQEKRRVITKVLTKEDACRIADKLSKQSDGCYPYWSHLCYEMDGNGKLIFN